MNNGSENEAPKIKSKSMGRRSLVAVCQLTSGPDLAENFAAAERLIGHARSRDCKVW
jgi:hypothetical protein